MTASGSRNQKIDRRSPRVWHILTGEYPPCPGGVADYTCLVAEELARRHHEVVVWTGSALGTEPSIGRAPPPGLVIRREKDPWSPSGLRRLARHLDAQPLPRRLLVQYAPNAWGYRGANLAFTRWLRRRAWTGDDVRTMIHEGYYPLQIADAPQRWILSVIHRAMVRDVLIASERAYCSMPYWQTALRPYDRRRRRAIVWHPVSSNVPVAIDPPRLERLRSDHGIGRRPVIGHFGTYGGDSTRLLRTLVPAILDADDSRILLLIGRFSDRFHREIARAHSAVASRIISTGALPPAELSLHLQLCDVLLQPYEFGVSTRRGTIMAGLAHGRAIATTFGIVTEPFWTSSGCVAGVDAAKPTGLVALVNHLLARQDVREEHERTAIDVYQSRYTVGHVVDRLLDDESDSPRNRDPGYRSRPTAIGPGTP